MNENNRQALLRMSTAIVHRGPDADTYFESASDASGNGVLFAHWRLAILDLSNAAWQPMTDDTGPQHSFACNDEVTTTLTFERAMDSIDQRFVLISSGGDPRVPALV